MLWFETGDVSEIHTMTRERILCFDVETTGLNAGRDEILQLGILDGAGTILFSDYVRPMRHRSWPAAERVHGIKPDMVRAKRSMPELVSELDGFFSRAMLLVGYNLAFDIEFLKSSGVAMPPCPSFDVMQEFAPVAGRRRSRSNSYAWTKLADCARYYGVRFRLHGALDDAWATLACFWRMLEDDGSVYASPGSTPYLEVVRRGRADA